MRTISTPTPGGHDPCRTQPPSIGRTACTNGSKSSSAPARRRHDAGHRPTVGHDAIRHGHLAGPDVSLSRMSWVKPNFLWMMCRSGWGTKAGPFFVDPISIDCSTSAT
ncbi:MAG TPA: DUF4291 family protein [Burkholderiaceae bacterium]|nr:DUF4291 family protein [Burkholderiaceae bacterium]